MGAVWQGWAGAEEGRRRMVHEVLETQMGTDLGISVSDDLRSIDCVTSCVWGAGQIQVCSHHGHLFYHKRPW